MKISKIFIILAAIFIAQLYLASALTISSVNSNPSEVQPGETVTLDLTIKNDLSDVDNVVVNLELDKTLPFAPYQSSNQRTIDSISSGEHETIHFSLIALSDAASGTYTIPVTMTYLLNNGIPGQDSKGLISITINAKPQIGISSEQSSLIRGTSGKMTIKIVNSGLGNSKFLTVSVNSVQGITLTSPNSIYIGNIDSNDFDTADFNVFVNANAPSTINLPVQITYTDSTNNQIIENEIIPIKTYTQKEAVSLGLVKGNSIFLIVLIIVLVIVVFLIYRRARKKHRNNGRT